MCDLANRSSCLGNMGKRIGPVKLSKWELPIPGSKSYWDGVCSQIEKKHKRVRDAYPFLSTLSSQTSDRTQFRDDFKFKISPPTPMHKTHFDLESFHPIPTDNSNVIKHREDEVIRDNVEMPVRKLCVERANEKKIFAKKSCPLHENPTRPLASSSSLRIFDDEISKYLKTDETTILTLPEIAEGKKSIVELRRSESTSASSTRSKDTKKSLKEALEERRSSKAPKLAAASLLPSFARPVSTDSSAGTRSSLESEEELPKAQSLDLNETISTRDFLRVPNLSFVSSHPSFRKLSFVDSVDEEKSVQSSTVFVEKNREVECQTQQDEVLQKTKKKKKEKAKNISDLEKEYSYKALRVLTKKSNVKIERKTNDSTEKSSIASEVSSIPDEPKLKKLMRSLDNESSIDFREVRQKLKRLTSRASESIDSNSKIEARTIYSASRSTSSSSPDFESKAIEIPSTDALEKIPETKVFQRAYIDKCHACLFKPFKSEVKVTRELPLTTLLSVVKSPTKFRVISSSSSSSSSSEELQIPSVYECENDQYDFADIEPMDFPSGIYKSKVSEIKNQPRVSFDHSNLTKPTQSPQKSQSDHHLKEQSLSIQSPERSKTSTPSNQSSESDDARGPQDGDKLPSSKILAPCHAPIVLRKSLEPYRALKQKKFMSLRARAAAITAVSSEGSETDSQEEGVGTKKLEETVEEEKKEVTKKKKKKKKKKKLMRMKSFVEKMTEFSTSMDSRDVMVKAKMLKRAKTTFDLLDASEETESEESSEEEEEVSVETKDIEVEEKEEQIPLAEAIIQHRAASPPSPIMSSRDVVEIVKECLLQDDFSAANLLESLSKEFRKRLNDKYEKLKFSEDSKYLKLGLNLFNALIDSRRYLKPSSFDPNLKFSHKQPPLTNSRQLRRILPPKSFQLVAPILGMPKYTESIRKDDDSLSSVSTKTDCTFDLIVHPPTPRDEGKSSQSSEVNPYSLFLKKPRRKVVIWRPLREEDMKGYDPEATLEKRATRLMDRICKEFCDWVRQLGEQVIDEETLKDMFEINFSSDACKSMQVIIKEMPTVPLPVVKVRYCPEASQLESTRKELRKDVKVERRPKQTFAFGRALPRGLRFVPPRTRVATKWLDCEHIPKDLKKMDVVWDGIGNLDSVQEFFNFLKNKKVLRSSKLLRNLNKSIKAQVQPA